MSDIILVILLQFIRFLSMMRKGETMKKQICWLMMISLFLTLFFYNKWYYPPLPKQLGAVSKREVLNRIQHSEESLVKIEENEDYEFYIFHMNQEKAYDDLKEHMKKKGYAFHSQEGAGYFFYKDQQRFIVTSQMWTGKYVIFQIPKDKS
jgi:virulence-associated protein VapD